MDVKSLLAEKVYAVEGHLTIDHGWGILTLRFLTYDLSESVKVNYEILSADLQKTQGEISLKLAALPFLLELIKVGAKRPLTFTSGNQSQAADHGR